jgi:hypothetical protein
MNNDTFPSRHEFLLGVRLYIEHDPEAAAFVQQHVADGLRRTMVRLREQASAAEAALVVAVGLRPKRIEIPLILHYVDTYPTFCDWTWMKQYHKQKGGSSD